MAKLVSKQDYLCRRLRERIASGEYAPGAPLPSERMLIAEYGVSRTAVRQALGRLAAMGLICRRKGSGSTVAARAGEILASAPGRRAAFVVPYDNANNPVHVATLRALQEQGAGEFSFRLLGGGRRLDFRRLEALGIEAAVVDGSFATATPAPPAAWGGRVFLFNRASQNYDYVTTDNFSGGRMMAQHLLARGHRRVGVIHFGARDEADFAERLLGLRDALATAGLRPAKESRIALYDFAAYPPRAAARAMLGEIRAGRVTAVALITDLLALPFYQAAEEAGMRPGRDFALIGFDDQPFARFLSPSLTTIRQPVGAIAARLLAAMRQSAAAPGLRAFCREALPPAILVRESSGGA